jgi:hypothetical protein
MELHLLVLQPKSSLCAARKAPGHRGARRLGLRLEFRLNQHGRNLEPRRAWGHDEEGGGEDDGLARRRTGEDAVDAWARARHSVIERRWAGERWMVGMRPVGGRLRA